MAKKKAAPAIVPIADYSGLLGDVVSLLEAARHMSARSVNAVMTATYWEIGRRIVESEQGGEGRADYGQELLKRLAGDLTARFGRGFSDRSLYKMRLFYLSHTGNSPTLSANSGDEISPTVSAKSSGVPSISASPTNSILPTVSAKSQNVQETASASFLFTKHLAQRFPLPWSHYVKLLSVQDEKARRFYETEALRGGWSVRQLDRRITTLFYQRTLLSKNKAAALRKGAERQPSDLVTPDEEIKDPLVLEFLNLKDEYSEHELEEALIHEGTGTGPVVCGLSTRCEAAAGSSRGRRSSVAHGSKHQTIAVEPRSGDRCDICRTQYE